MTGWYEFTLTAAFVAGLTGGVHCAAMCGPLVGIVCGGRPWLRQALAYNAGRIASYGVAGALTGALGAAGLGLRGEPATQQWMLAIMSLALILLAGYVAGIRSIARGVEAAGTVLWRRVEPYARHFLPADTSGRAFGLGLVWGWLPCGMVYLALIAALATADPLHGAALMAAFGLGTLPNLLAISAWFRCAARLARSRLLRLAVAATMALAGVAGIARAAQPTARFAEGSWCLQIPGIASLLGLGP